MDPVTHGLASYALARALFPRMPRPAVAAVVIAGMAADLDRFTVLASPALYLSTHRTATHSLLGIAFLAGLFAGGSYILSRRNPEPRISISRLFLAALLAAAVHLTLDVCQSEGVALIWPFRTTRFALDWITGLDPWILAILLAGVLLPALFGLITEEIGARSKRPRGRSAAGLALAAVLAYLGARAILHADAVATLTARNYRGESPRRAEAFPEAASLFTWHGLVETESALHEVPVGVGPGATFDPEAGTVIFKPEPSPLLEIGRNTRAAREFLRAARFPKATIEKTESGYRFTLRDLRGAVAGDTRDAVAVLVKLSPEAKLLSQEIVWERDLGNR